jgi:hypothetical protein
MPWKLQLKEAQDRQNVFKICLLIFLKEEIKYFLEPTNLKFNQ